MADLRNLGGLIRRDRDLSKIAIIDLGGEESPREFTYAQLDTMANGVARSLATRGLECGDRVAILSANRTEYLAAYYGIMRAGFVAVPVNFKFPRQTIHFIVRDCGAKLVFCDGPRAPDCPPDIPCVTFGAGFDAFVDPGPYETIIPAPNDPAMFLYTSGSTGTPKGVVLSHASHIWVVQVRLAPGLDRHRYLIAAPLYHMNALALSLLAGAAHATIVLLPQFTARAYIEAIGRYRCTWLTAVPPMIAMMLREADLLKRTDISSVEFVRMGSAPVSHGLMQALHRALPRAAVTNAYGTTEGGPVVFGPHPKGLSQPEMSVGYPHPQVQVRLVDGANRDAEQGVLEMKSPAIMLGYHNRPDVPTPITPDGFYITGDVFRRDSDGFYYFVGRTDDMFVSGGENIYPADVERMLERHPDVAQTAVVPIDDEIKGQKPVAFVIREHGRALDADAVKRFALANAPAYQHPRFVWFVDELPLASTNKLDRAALRRMAEERLTETTDDTVRARVEIDRRLPVGDEIFLDHVGHFVPNAEAASRALALAGFAPTPISIQTTPDPAIGVRPTGTGNVTAMLERGYLEVLFKTADTALGREFDTAFARYPGLHLAAFAVADAAKARGRLMMAGLRVRPLVEMKRPVGTASGTGTAAFTIARVEPDVMPEGRIQMLTHHTEHTVWQPRWLAHPNTAIGLIDVVIAVANVEEAALRFVRFAGRSATPKSFGQIVRLDRGGVVLMNAAAFAAMLPELAIPSLPYIGAYGVAVQSLATVEGVLRGSRLAARRIQDGLIVSFPPELGRGAWLFVERADALPWRK